MHESKKKKKRRMKAYFKNSKKIEEATGNNFKLLLATDINVSSLRKKQHS